MVLDPLIGMSVGRHDFKQALFSCGVSVSGSTITLLLLVAVLFDVVVELVVGVIETD